MIEPGICMSENSTRIVGLRLDDDQSLLGGLRSYDDEPFVC